MARAHRRPTADINPSRGGDVRQQLLTKGGSFSFFQAMRLLRHLTKGVEECDESHKKGTVRVRPQLTLSFPPADIHSIDAIDAEGESKRYQITATFLGLYGATSPLPTFYTEDLLDEAGRDESVTRDFLDIFNQRLYELLYQGWLKYRQYLQVSEENNSIHLERLYCLLGMGSDAIRNGGNEAGDAFRLLRYTGLFAQFPRSAAGLSTLLSDALKDMPLKIVPCVLRKAKIPESQQFKVGLSGTTLGHDTFVGEQIDDRMGKFRIQIGPLDQAAFLNFTPGSRGYDDLVALTELYVTESLAYEVELILAEKQAKTVRLGDPVRSVLGVTTWVFSQKHLGEVRTRFTVNRDPNVHVK